MSDVRFRPLTRADLPLVLRWLHAPRVRAWWPGERPTMADVEDQYGPGLDGTDPLQAFVIVWGGRPVGVVQCYRQADYPDWDEAIGVAGAAGIDYFIGEEELCGRGVGPAVITAFLALVFDLYPDLPTVVAVPQDVNRASCRALVKAGFTRVAERRLDPDDRSAAGLSAVYARGRPD